MIKLIIIVFLKKYVQDKHQYSNEKIPEIRVDYEDKDEVIEALVLNVLWQMNSDRKAGPLKQLQGHIWKDAYEKQLIFGQ